MYAQPRLRPWSSHKWLPPGYATRLRRDDDIDNGDRFASVEEEGDTGGEKPAREGSGEGLVAEEREERVGGVSV